MNENLIVALEEKKVVSATFRKLHPQKKQKLYLTGLNEFAREVFDRVSIDRIADAAGVSKGSLFQYFGSKENVLKFLFEIFIDNYKREWDENYHQSREVRTLDRLRIYFNAQLEFWDERRLEYFFYIKMMYENSRELSGSFIERLTSVQREYVEALLRRGIRTAEIRQDISVERIVFVINAVAEAMHRRISADMSKLKRREQLAELIDSAEKILFDGIKG